MEIKKQRIIYLIQEMLPLLKFSGGSLDIYYYDFLLRALTQLEKNEEVRNVVNNIKKSYFTTPSLNGHTLCKDKKISNELSLYFLRLKETLYLECDTKDAQPVSQMQESIFRETKRDTMIKTIERILALIKRDYGTYASFYEFFEYILDMLHRPYELYEVAEKFRVVYAGMGSFNDLILTEGHHEFEFLRSSLYQQGMEEILLSRGAE